MSGWFTSTGVCIPKKRCGVSVTRFMVLPSGRLLCFTRTGSCILEERGAVKLRGERSSSTAQAEECCASQALAATCYRSAVVYKWWLKVLSTRRVLWVAGMGCHVLAVVYKW